MREKPVPVRVGKELQPLQTSMDGIKEETNLEKEMLGFCGHFQTALHSYATLRLVKETLYCV